MPQVLVGALATGIASGITLGTAATLTTAATATTFAFNFVAAGLTLALGALQYVLTPRGKSKNLSSGFSQETQGITRNVRQAITERLTLYGVARVGGAITFIESNDSDKFLHMVIVLADHEVQEVGEIWFDENSIPPDYINSEGDVIEGTYKDTARICIHKGEPGQVADPKLIDETTRDETFVGSEMSYIYVRLLFDRDIYPSGIPEVTAYVKGRKLFDPRTSTTEYTSNAALIVNNYLTAKTDDFTSGIATLQDDIDEQVLIASANICDEFVIVSDLDDEIISADSATDTLTMNGKNSRLLFQTGDKITAVGASLPAGLVNGDIYYAMPYQRKDTPRLRLATSLKNAQTGVYVNITSGGTGTLRKTAEPRYYGGGIVSTKDTPEQVVTDLLSAMGGSAIYIGGKWRILAAAWQPPTHSFDESHVISQLSIRTKLGMRDRFNVVKGVYVSPLNDGEATDYPPVRNSLYLAQDNDVVSYFDHDLTMTTRAHTAQRLAKIKLERARQEIAFEAEFNLHAMAVQPGDVIKFSDKVMGWDEKEFEVQTWSINSRNVEGAPLFFIKMSLRETASEVFDWNNGEETLVDPAPDTNLPSPLIVLPPIGLLVEGNTVLTSVGDKTYEFLISWQPPQDIFVTSGGYYEVEFKKSASATWLRSMKAEDGDTAVLVKQIDHDVSYDVRIRSVNSLLVRSGYNQLLGFTIDSTGGAATRTDYGRVIDIFDTSLDYGLMTDAVTDTEDFGSIV